jgi:hypothetical protein
MEMREVELGRGIWREKVAVFESPSTGEENLALNTMKWLIYFKKK